MLLCSEWNKLLVVLKNYLEYKKYSNYVSYGWKDTLEHSKQAIFDLHLIQ